MPWNDSDVPDQSGKTIIVTGANSGIGLETARVLAARGAHVVLACRSAERAQEAIDAIKAKHADAKVEHGALDLGDLASVSAFAEHHRKTHGKLDVLINNAGVMVPPFGKTKDGFELQFGINHLGHFALTAQLIDLVLAADNGRVVNVSSIAHRNGTINFDDLGWDNGYKKIPAYGQSKLANLLFTYELQRRLDAAGHDTRVLAAHPGWASTNLQRTSLLARMLNPFFAQDALGGALPTLRAATDVDAAPGTYWGPSGFQQIRGAPKRVESNKRSHDEAVAKRLWDVSQTLTKTEFALSN